MPELLPFKSRLLATDGVVNHDPIPVFLIHMAV